MLIHPSTHGVLYAELIDELHKEGNSPLAMLFTASSLCRFGVLNIRRDTGRFSIPAEPFVAIIDARPKTGGLLPSDFDKLSLARLSTATSLRVILATEMHDAPYAAASVAPIMKKESALIVETTPDRYDAWVDLMRRFDAHKPLIVFAPQTTSTARAN
jgi:hypothetical protein